MEFNTSKYAMGLEEMIRTVDDVDGVKARLIAFYCRIEGRA